MTRAELLKQAKEAGIRGRHRMRKGELMLALKRNQLWKCPIGWQYDLEELIAAA